jgi:hypothetical protein
LQPSLHRAPTTNTSINLSLAHTPNSISLAHTINHINCPLAHIFDPSSIISNMANDQPKIGKKKKTKAEKKRARKERKAALKEQKRIERESPNYVDPGYCPPAIEVQDIVDWLLAQARMPHPLHTSLEVMMMWLQAMDTGLPLGALRRRSGRVMHAWREQARPGQAFTREEQELVLVREGPVMDAPVITITWQDFQQSRQAATSPAAAPPTAAPSTAAPPTARGAAVVDPLTWLSPKVPLSFDTYGRPTDDQPGLGNPSQQPQPQPSPVPSWLSSTFRGRAWQPPGWVWEHQRVAAEEQVARDLQREVDEQLNRSLQQSLGDEEKN